MNISDLQFSVASVAAYIKDFSINYIKDTFEPEYPIVSVETDTYKRSSEEFVMPVKKSNRGRKKKNVKSDKKFKSNISFIIKLVIHREPKADNYTKTAVRCVEHIGCEVFIKFYNIRAFNGGKIVCVGILEENKSDFFECMKIIRNYLTKRKILSFSFISGPLLEALHKQAYDAFEIINITSTLENYQFSVGRHINLYYLKDYFVECSKKKVININYNGIYEYFVDNIINDNYTFNVDGLIKGVQQVNKVRIHFVDRDRLHNELSLISLKKIHLDFESYWTEFKNRNAYYTSPYFLKNLRYNFLKHYIIFIFAPIRVRCDEQDDSVVNSVIFKETKNTLMVKKTIGEFEINYRIFGTGIINIQGGNSREISEIAKKKICSSLSETFLYDPERPPLLKWQDCLEPISIDKKINDNVDKTDEDSSDD